MLITMNVFITGAHGFIGHYLVKELINNGYQIKGLSRKAQPSHEDKEFIKGDITKPETFSSALKDIDMVFHNAAYAMDWGKKNDFYEINVNGTKNVAEACREHGIKRLIYTSSAGVYGYPKNEKIITEETEKKPLNMYQKTKYEGEKVLKAYDDLLISAIRPPLVFGPGSPALKIAFSNLEKGKMMYIGDGTQQLSIAHPVDVARCMRLIAENDTKGEAFNVVSFICQINEFMEAISEKTGIDPPTKHVPFSIAYAVAWLTETFKKNPTLTRFRVKSLGTTRIISAEKAKQSIGYSPTYDFSSTVEEIVEWYKKDLTGKQP